jgi:hypothetical protein
VQTWEFLLDRGAILDHWGELSNGGAPSATVGAIRQQLNNARIFLGGVPLARLRAAANPPEWITGNTLNPCPAGTAFWDGTTGAAAE